MSRHMLSITSFSGLTLLFRSVSGRVFVRISPPGFSLIRNLCPSFSHSVWERSPSPAQSGNGSKVRHPQLAILGLGRLLIEFPIPRAELSLSLVAGMTPVESFEALKNLQGYFGLTRLELRTPGLELCDSSHLVAIQTLAGAVIHMSSLIYLSIPGGFVTEALLLHISLLPLLEELVILPASLTHSLPGRERYGFVSLRSLDIPNGTFLRRFLSYRIRDLEGLKVRALDRDSILEIARGLPSLRYLSIEGQDIASPQIFVLGACFQLEKITISTRRPSGMNNLDLHRFRDMFRNLRSLSITIRDFSRGTELRHTTHSREGIEASWVVRTNGVGHGV